MKLTYMKTEQNLLVFTLQPHHSAMKTELFENSNENRTFENDPFQC